MNSVEKEEMENIRKFGINRETFERVRQGELILTQFDTNYLLAHIDFLENKNNTLVSGLDKIASGMLTGGESAEQAQYSLEDATPIK